LKILNIPGSKKLAKSTCLRPKTKNCLWCHNQYTIKRKQTALCQQCRTIRHNQQKARLYQQRSEYRSHILNNVLPDIPVNLHPLTRYYATELVNRLFSADGKPIQDKQPDGTKSRRGSTDGRSTYFRDLAGQLDYLADQAAEDEWWSAHPATDVFFDLNQIETDDNPD
jgi:hypothetical protein